LYRLVDVALVAACVFSACIALLFLWVMPTLGLSPMSVPVLLVFITAWLAFSIALLMWVRKGRGLSIPGFYSFIRQPSPADSAERAAWVWGRRVLRAWQVGLASLVILVPIEVLSGHWHYTGP